MVEVLPSENAGWISSVHLCMTLFWWKPLNFFSSFNDKPVNEAAVGPVGKELFEREQEDLLSDLKDIPKKACDRRVSWVLSCLVFSLNIAALCYNYHIWQLQINEFVKRARAGKIHAYIISHLKKEMPAMMGKAKTQQRLIDDLEDEFAKVVILLLILLTFMQPLKHTLIVLSFGSFYF